MHTTEQVTELAALAEPVRRWLQANSLPHAQVVIDDTCCRIFFQEALLTRSQLHQHRTPDPRITGPVGVEGCGGIPGATGNPGMPGPAGIPSDPPDILGVISKIKALRRDGNALIDRIEEPSGFRCPENTLALRKFQEGVMWLGQTLRAIDNAFPGASPTPYPHSCDPSSPVIEPQADAASSDNDGVKTLFQDMLKASGDNPAGCEGTEGPCGGPAGPTLDEPKL